MKACGVVGRRRDIVAMVAPRRCRTRPLASLLAALVLVAMLPATAGAHANLERADPAPGSSLQGAPERVRLWFTERVDPGSAEIGVYGATGERVDAGGRVVHGGGTSLSVSMRRGLPSGTYLVRWRNVSAVDGHAVAGSFAFGIGTPVDAAALTVAPAEEQQLGPPLLPSALVRALVYLPLAVTVGALGLGLLVLPRVSRGLEAVDVHASGAPSRRRRADPDRRPPETRLSGPRERSGLGDRTVTVTAGGQTPSGVSTVAASAISNGALTRATEAPRNGVSPIRGALDGLAARTLGVARWGAAALLLASVLAILHQAAVIAGVWSLAAIGPDGLAETLASRYGLTLAGRAGLALALVALLCVARDRRPIGQLRRLAAFGLGLGALLVTSVGSHGAAAEEAGRWAWLRALEEWSGVSGAVLAAAAGCAVAFAAHLWLRRGREAAGAQTPRDDEQPRAAVAVGRFLPWRGRHSTASLGADRRRGVRPNAVTAASNDRGDAPSGAAGRLLGVALLAAPFLVAAVAGITVALDWLHLLAMALWVGGLVALVLALPPALRDLSGEGASTIVRAVVPAFTRIALPAVAVLVATGIYAASLHAGEARALTGTAYGLSLLAKLTLFVPLVALGALNRAIGREGSWRQRLEGVGTARALSRFVPRVRVEALLAALVLVATGVLTSLSPPASDAAGLPEPAFQQEQDTGEGRLSLAVDPAIAGANALSVRLDDGGPVSDAEKVLIRLTPPGGAQAERELVVPHAGDGGYAITTPELGMPGAWGVEAIVRRGSRNDARAVFEVPVVAPLAAESGGLRAELRLRPSRPVAGEGAELELTLRDRAGRPPPASRVELALLMPAHSHYEDVVLGDLGGGRYRTYAELSMDGEWVAQVRVIRPRGAPVPINIRFQVAPAS